jgi:pimeloyl-ACP methyl ester carboxylesterase
MAKPTTFFIPGSYCPALFYYDVVQSLREKGYDAIVHDLPSASRAPPLPPAGLTEDAVILREKLGALVEQGNEVITLGHSYGGLPMRETFRGFGKQQRAAEGKPGGVVRVIYLAAMATSGEQAAMDIISDQKYDDSGIQEWPVPVRQRHILSSL